MFFLSIPVSAIGDFYQQLTDHLLDSLNWGVDVSLKVIGFMMIMFLTVYLFKK